MGQLRDVVPKWLKNNPERRHTVARVAIISAGLAAWPCPK